MIEKPDFSKDTGPGVPGVDNNHFPGRSYSSHQVEDVGCSMCRAETAYWAHDGTILYGTEGQFREYVWTLPPQDIPSKGVVCDACLKPFIDRGELELYADSGKMIEKLSPPAMKALFTSAARSVVNDFADVSQMPLLSEGFALPLTDDEIYQIFLFADRREGTKSIHTAGESYALSALAFGKVLGDPSFEAAADYYIDIWLPAQEPDATDLETYTEEELLRHMLETMEFR
jgi:hypothetical protein